MSFRRTKAIVLRHFYLLRGSYSRLVPLFVWVTIDIVLWGFMARYMTRVSAGHDFVPVLLGAVLLWDFFIRVMQGVTTAFFEDVWSCNFLNVFATPLTIPEYVGGLVLSSMATSTVGLLVMLAAASVFFGLSFVACGLWVVGYLLVLFAFGIALGVFGCGIVLRLGPAAEWFIWPIPAVISPFVGVFYPLSTLPAWMQAVAYVLPPSYVFEGLRALVAGAPAYGLSLAWSAVLSCVYLGLGGLFFTRIYRHAVRTGLIARYSAETLS